MISLFIFIWLNSLTGKQKNIEVLIAGIYFGVMTFVLIRLFPHRKNILLACSSGIGASGVAASVSYAALTDVGFTPKITLILMLVVPLVELVAFLFIAETNAIDLATSDSSSTTSLIDDSTDGCRTDTETQPMTFSEKRQYLPKLIPYFTPLLVNYICEYLINQMVSSI